MDLIKKEPIRVEKKEPLQSRPVEILIKQKWVRVEGSKHLQAILFDVIDGNNCYIDPNNEGYFPIEFEIQKDLSEDELKLHCQNWFLKNNISSIYKPTDKIETLIKQKEKQILRKQAIEELTKEKKIKKPERR